MENKFLNERNCKEGYYNTKQCLSLLNLTIKLWNAVRAEENLYEHRIQKKDSVLLIDFYPVDILDKLKAKQDELLKDVYENYYTYSQVRELLGRNNERLARDEKKLKSIPVPSLLRGFFGKKDKFWLYSKQTVDDYVQKKHSKELKNVALENKYDTFVYQLAVEGITFPDHLKNTELLWKTYIRSKLENSEQNEVTALKRIRMFIKCSECVVIIPKEIYNLTAKEINLSLMNQKIAKTHRQVIYLFLQEVESFIKDANKRTFNLEQIKNPFKEKKETINKELYDFEEYLTFFRYANDVDLHKEMALKDIRSYFSDSSYVFRRYDSAWLYILVHLNNPWRHSDITDSFPRVDLRELNIKDLSWFQENGVTTEIAKKIVYQIKRKAMIHNKTGSKRIFFCSDELAVSLATAVIICELRTQRDNPLSESIIDFKNKHRKFTTAISRYFFQSMESPLSFKSRKMNRSIISYMYSIISQNKISNELEIAKYFRGHKDFDTTNIYIDIPQSQIDFITSQLFDRGHFGYIPKIFSQILYGEQDKGIDLTDSVVALQQRFGTIQKLEATAGFLNEVYWEKKIVEDILREMSQEELRERFQQLMTYQLPSKEENFQCLVSQSGCIYPRRECPTCPLSIPNFYALSSISDRFVRKLSYLLNDFDKLEHEAEKTRFANLFHTDMMLIKEAISKFGKSEVFSFIDVSSEQMSQLLGQLPSISSYVTIKVEEECQNVTS